MADHDEAWPLVQEAILAFNAKVPDIAKARHALAVVIKAEAWKQYRPPVGKECDYTTFAQWVTAKVPRGLGTTLENIKKIAEGDQELAEALNHVIKHGGDRRSEGFKNDNVMLEAEQGNTRSYALRRLGKSAPALHAKVLAGDLSANAAMVEAGFRPKTVSVPVAKPEAVARSLQKYMKPDDIAKLIALLLGREA